MVERPIDENSREPLLPYARQWLDEDDIEAVVRALRGELITTGSLVGTFERELAAVAGASFAVAVSSGTAALHIAYQAAGLGPGDELVTSPLTFVSTATTALQLGATVRFADVESDTGNLDPRSAAGVVGAGTKLIVPVDYAGHPAAYDELNQLADRHGASLVADAAHSFGAFYRDQPVGGLAAATATSFHPVKPITTAEGGAMLTNNESWWQRGRAFRNHGIVRDSARHREAGGPWHYEVQSFGLNYRLPDVLCALGSSQLKKLDRFIDRRREIADRYNEAFADLAALELPAIRDEVRHSWHLYVLRVRDATRRRPLFEFLRGRGLGVQVHYTPVYLHPLFRDLGFENGVAPRAEDFAARAISIPIFPRMSDSDVQRVIDTVADGVRELL